MLQLINEMVNMVWIVQIFPSNHVAAAASTGNQSVSVGDQNMMLVVNKKECKSNPGIPPAIVPGIY